MIAVGITVLIAAGLVVAHVTGRGAERNAFWWRMNVDPILRREVLEKLAELEGVKLEGRE